MTHKLLFIFLAVIFSASAVFAQTTSFTFQGKLNDGAIAANGTYQFQFKMFDANADGNQIGQTLADIPATVTNGIFAVNLDFGAASYDGAARFIEIGVRLNGGGQNYTILNPRQAVASTPYSVKSLKSDEATTAVTANNSLNLGGILASQYVQTTDTRMSDDRNPLANSSFYIQNGTSLQTTSNFNVSGEGRASILNAVTQFNLNGVRILSGSLGNGNLFAGFEAGINNTSAGDGSTFVGVRAGKSNTTGIYNSFFGYQAGLSNLTTEGNSFFGTFAGMNNIASGNSFFGSFTGRDNTTGIENSYFGQAAGMQTSTGKSNSFFGNGAGYSNLTGGNNTFVGTLAGLSNTIEDNNTFIGFKANGAAGITNATAIGANSIVSTSNTMVLGTPAVTVKVPGILDVTQQYNLNGARILSFGSTNANLFAGFESGTSGDASAFFGTRAGKSNTTGSFNSFFGYNVALNNSTGGFNTFLGSFAGSSNTIENNNTFIGYGANGAAGITNATAIGVFASVTTSDTMVLGTNAVTVQVPGSLNVAGTFGANVLNSATVYKINNNRVFHLTGTDNTFVGFESGNSIGAGNFNAFYGSYSGKNTTTGLNNAFFGSYAGRANITGGNNAFFGTNAGLSNKASFNAFFGSAAGSANLNGASNSFFGTLSGANSESGDNNSFFGRSAGSEVTTGSNNTFIGALSGVLNTNTAGSNNTAIGYNTKFGAGVSNSIAIGANVSVSSSNTIEIGTSGMTINLGGNVYASSYSGGPVSTTSIFSSLGDIDDLSTQKITIVDDPNIPGFPDYSTFFGAKFKEVRTDELLVQNLSVGGGSSSALCYSQPVGSQFMKVLPCSSSLRFKENVQNFTGGLSVLNRLRPVTFDWKSNGTKDIGFIAEEVNAVEPLLSTFNGEGQLQGVKYAQITTVLVNSVKEQQTQIDQLQEQIKLQQTQIDALKALVCSQNPTAAVCALPEKK